MIIGLCGKAGSGKNFIADILARDYNFEVISFADPLKKICQDVFNFSHEQLWGPSDMRNKHDERYPQCTATYKDLSYTKYLTPRETLQKLGDWGRDCYENIWVDYALKTAKKITLLTNYPVVISDVRYRNEMESIQKANGTVIRIDRGFTSLTGTLATHQSETEQSEIPDSDFDFILKNVEDLDVLNESIKQIIDQIL